MFDQSEAQKLMAWGKGQIDLRFLMVVRHSSRHFGSFKISRLFRELGPAQRIHAGESLYTGREILCSAQTGAMTV